MLGLLDVIFCLFVTELWSLLFMSEFRFSSISGEKRKELCFYIDNTLIGIVACYVFAYLKQSYGA